MGDEKHGFHEVRYHERITDGNWAFNNLLLSP